MSKDQLDRRNRFTEYAILEFGHALRYDLACRWAALGEGTARDATSAISLIDRCEKILTDVVGRSLVPFYPFYLLILLQSIEAGQQATLQNSAYGHYYQYLITHALSEFTKPEELEEFFHYCSQLAWFFRSSSRREIEGRYLCMFHENYCKEYVFVQFEKRLDNLLRAKILVEQDGGFAFRYPYTFYFS